MESKRKACWHSDFAPCSVFVPEDEATLADDLPAWALAVLAEQSPSFAFLADPREDIYSIKDGEPVS